MASVIALVFALLALSGLVFTAIAMWAAREFVRDVRRDAAVGEEFAPGVSVLKPLKGVDSRMMETLRSHCRQRYAGPWELIFGVGSVADPAVALVEALRGEFPEVRMEMVIATERLGTSGKVSTLVQMLPRAQYGFVLVNDSDIHVGTEYLARVMRGFREAGVGMVTALYRGRPVAHDRAARDGDGTGQRTAAGRVPVWAKLEAIGIAMDFAPGVMTVRMLEHGIRFGLGSTLAMRREALEGAGGFEAVVDVLADDYELGRRIAAAGWRVELTGEVVETTVPAYRWREFWEHQVRWARTVRDARRMGYLGLGITYALAWALAAWVASGFALWGGALVSVVLLARVALALSVGVGVLGDGAMLKNLWLLPVRDCFGLVLWLWSFAGNTVVWRGERFRVRNGRLEAIGGGRGRSSEA